MRRINDHLIIEDDFENEFVYFQKPTPSLFGLAGGENVVYIGSFSRLLRPALHPCQLHGTAALSPGKIYKNSSLYKSDCFQGRTDRALPVYPRRASRLPRRESSAACTSQKLKALSQAVRETFGQDCQIQTGAAGTSLALTLPCSLTGSELTRQSPDTVVWDWRFSEKTEPRSPWFSPAPPFHPRIFCLPVSF